ncbi:hypothetical protein C499_14870 [Halogeometricum borinquense DSM 11551]|uniref:Uncharacterized protein n=1 Tax=Halogeometricum borinquense (strain ATCC 700274 / DSM 11551 / JCM 10706 / KCTC 4070 / PR3) TaxID=469382 RepID=E4NTW0_HALBP|nr:hypothetical protein [Halogeometricum borinquense]ADQ68265.1 hypothetical protein Hbor_27190 [Halogeometricum borinquense DSM 11551]ELY24692.1 hypothetical protein C499_14870 [Halogeometricum borinquense DSM 11551]
MTAPAIYDHYRADDAAVSDGVYRVVGTDDETVTLLRVADADRRRSNTGEIVTIHRDRLDGFVSAENPDGNRPVGAAVASQLRMVYWSVRAFVRQLAAHPLPAAVAGAFVLVGALGDHFFQLPEAALSASIIVGSLGLAYVGSGRL